MSAPVMHRKVQKARKMRPAYLRLVAPGEARANSTDQDLKHCTDALAIAAAVFSPESLRNEGVYRTSVDSDGFVWYVVIGEGGRFLQCAFMPEYVASPEMGQQMQAWRKMQVTQ